MKDRTLKPKVIHDSPQAITGLAFKDTGKYMTIFVATEFSILTIALSSRESEEKVIKENLLR